MPSKRINLTDRTGRALTVGDDVRIMTNAHDLRAHFANHCELDDEEENEIFCGRKGKVIELDKSDNTVYVAFCDLRSEIDPGAITEWWFPVGTIDAPDNTCDEHDEDDSYAADLNERLFEGEQFKDVTFKLQDGEVSAHKSVLAAASPVFAGMFHAPMQENLSGVVKLEGVKKTAMSIFLRLLYTGHVNAVDWTQETHHDLAGKWRFSHRSSDIHDDMHYEIEHVQDKLVFKQVVPGGITLQGEVIPDGEDWVAQFPSAQSISKVLLHLENANQLTTVYVSKVGTRRTPVVATKEIERMPLELLIETTKLAKRYMINSVASFAAEALKDRMKEAAEDAMVLETILSAAIAADLATVRVAAVDIAKSCKALRKRYDEDSLHPEVAAELQGIWPPAKKKKSKRARLA